MNIRRWFLIAGFAVALAAIAQGRASAAATCTVTPAATMAFGNYDVYAGAVSSTGTISITCTGGGNPVPSITLGAGSGTIANRHMTCTSGTCLTGFSTDQLHYNLYTTVAHTTVWGATGQPKSAGTCKNGTCTASVFGLIPAAVAGGTNDVAVGGYTDSVVITVAY